MSEQQDDKKENENKEQTTLLQKDTAKNIKKEADKKTQEIIDKIKVRLPEALKTYDEYIDEMRADNLALSSEREKYLRGLAIQNSHVFPLNTSNIDDPYSEPNYSDSIKLEFHDVTIHQWEYFQRMKAEAEDLDRLSRQPLLHYIQSKTPVPKEFEQLRKLKVAKELEQYRFGFWAFFRGSKDNFNRGDYIFIRDRVDSAEYRINNSLPFSPKTSNSSSTSNTPMSDSIT